MAETLDRMIALQGAVNFRDLGGYETGDGRARRAGARSFGPTAWAS